MRACSTGTVRISGSIDAMNAGSPVATLEDKGARCDVLQHALSRRLGGRSLRVPMSRLLTSRQKRAERLMQAR